MGLFDQLDGARTVARLASAPNGQIYGAFHKALPIVPLFMPDGNCRFGFTQLFNGYVRGPENTSLDMLQSAVKLGQIPGVPVDAVVTPEDYYDSLYIMAGSTSIFDAYVHLPEEHLVPVDPPPAGNDTAKDLQIAGLTSQVNALKAANGKASKLAKALLVQYPTKGGGSWVQLGKTGLPPIIDALAGMLLLCFLLVSTGCAANRAVRTAVVGQGAGIPALLECSNVVTKNPAMAPLLNARLDAAQAQVNIGNPLAGIFAFSANGLDPRAQAALIVISGKIDHLMQDVLASVQGAISGCRMGILSVPPPKP